MRPVSLFESERLTLKRAVEISLDSLRAYGSRYSRWAITYSGGKDSSATTSFVAWAVKSGLVSRPESITILYADTRQEYPPLAATATKFLAALDSDGFDARVVQPELDHRFYVYMLGRGVPPPHNQFRWCTRNLKIRPMELELERLRQAAGEKFLLINGVRLGESQIRDQRIALSCGKKGECGQGWFEVKPLGSVGDTLAPILHWRICHVYDWLYYDSRNPYTAIVSDIAAVYGEDDIRTGCVGCNLVNRDDALENIIKSSQWSHLKPLLELKPLFRELQHPTKRLRKSEVEVMADGRLASNGQRMGPLTMEAREIGLNRVLDIQARANVDLINVAEERRIREMWATNMWPQKWDGSELGADALIDVVSVLPGGRDSVVQPILLRKG